MFSKLADDDVGWDPNASKDIPIHAYVHVYRSISAEINMQAGAKRCICIWNLYIHLKSCIYRFIWLYIPINAEFRHWRDARDTFKIHSNPKSWCRLQQADIATVQPYLTSTHRAEVPAQLPCYVERQLNRYQYKWLTKPNLLISIDSLSDGNVLLPSRSTFRPLGKGSGRYV